MEEYKDKNDNTVYTATGKEAEKLAKAFFPNDPFFNPEKKSEADKKFDSITGFIFTYLYPATPFLQLADKLENKYAKKQGWFKLLVYLIPRLIVGAPFFLSGMLYLDNLFNEGWRVYSTNASFGIMLVISYFFTSINTQLTYLITWVTLITAYVLGYYQLLNSKNKK